MTDKILEQFDQAAAALENVVADLKPQHFDAPTPCSEWTVRQLINHIVGGNRMFTGLVTGSGPAPEQELGDDPLEALKDSRATLREAFSADGVMERAFQTPMGERPAPRLVTTRIVEMSLHGWDLAKATGHSIDLPQDVVDVCFDQLRAMLPADREGLPFGNEQHAEQDAAPVDRLAAFAGRVIA